MTENEGLNNGNGNGNDSGTVKRFSVERTNAFKANVRRSFGGGGQQNNRQNIGNNGGGTDRQGTARDTGSPFGNDVDTQPLRDETRRFDSGLDGGIGLDDGTGNEQRFSFGSFDTEQHESNGTLVDEEPVVKRFTVGDRTAEPKEKSTRSTSTRRTKAQTVTQDSANAVLQILFGMLCIVCGPHWELSEEESKEAAAPLARILSKLPARVASTINNGIDPIVFAYIMLSISGPRIKQTIAENKAKDKTRYVTKTQTVQQPNHGGNNGHGPDLAKFP